MVDRVRSDEEIIALLPDNTTGQISPQDIRDLFVTVRARTEEKAAVAQITDLHLEIAELKARVAALESGIPPPLSTYVEAGYVDQGYAL